jgi:hypothetical protein
MLRFYSVESKTTIWRRREICNYNEDPTPPRFTPLNPKQRRLGSVVLREPLGGWPLGNTSFRWVLMYSLTLKRVGFITFPCPLSRLTRRRHQHPPPPHGFVRPKPITEFSPYSLRPWRWSSMYLRNVCDTGHIHSARRTKNRIKIRKSIQFNPW